MQINSNRRSLVKYCATGMAASLMGFGPFSHAVDAEPMAIAQVVDMSAGQQDVSRDFMAGSKVAWQNLNARGGIRGRKIQHLVMEVDGTPDSVKDAWNAIISNGRCIAISGSVGNGLSEQLCALQKSAGISRSLPIIAPWMHNPAEKGNPEGLFDIFAGHRQQIEFAVRSLAVMGVPREVTVFAAPLYEQQSRSSVERAALATKISVNYVPASTFSTNGYKYQTEVPVVLFLGDTLQLHEFIQQLAMPTGRKCYVIALADVNLQVLAQMSKIPRQISVVATQVVPPVTSGTPVAREYREALGRLFDEEPTPQGLAGFIAARFTENALARVSQPVSRSSLFAALKKKEDSDLGGFNVIFDKAVRISQYVTQTVIARDGRVLR
ncbi:MAG: ABC transporter substrate-binding protein [Pseudomonadota bacterium]